MIIKADKFQGACKKILDAVDTKATTLVSDTLELVVENSILYLNVTNRAYYVSVKTPLETHEDFHAVVDAKLFLSLISKFTTETIELSIVDNVLVVKANGTYKLPFIFEGENLITVPKITIDNVTNELTIQNTALQSILKYNSRELLKSGVTRPVQQLFYVDEKGAITFKGGACVTKFDLEKPVVMTFTENVVKLFRLFKDETLALSLGNDLISSGEFQTKVLIQDSDTTLVAILPSDSALINTFPVEKIRQRAYDLYAHSVVVDKNVLLNSLNRLLLFAPTSTLNSAIHFEFKKDRLTVLDDRKENLEEFSYVGVPTIEEEYSASFNANDLKITIETCDEQYITLLFGNNTAVVFSCGNVRNVVPELG